MSRSGFTASLICLGNWSAAGFQAREVDFPEASRTVEAVWEQRFGWEILDTVSVYDYAMNNLIDQGLDPSEGR